MFLLPSPIIEVDFFDEKKIRLLIKRDDLIHHEMSGNKYRKLKYNLQYIKNSNFDAIVTKGGAFSNHIHAVAAASKVFGFQSIGIIRGEKVENETLNFAKTQGMELIFVSRTDYKNIDENNFQNFIPFKNKDLFFIPEGGSNDLALKGVAEMINEIETQINFLPDYICSSCGTGCTFAGIIAGLAGRQKVIGFSALKGDFMSDEVDAILKKNNTDSFQNWQIANDYHFGGYAKMTPQLRDFVNSFERKYQILLDPIYTSKMMFGIFDLIEKGFFKENSTVLVIHTGGLQGWNGFR